MRVAFVTPEVLPFSKTGGLADISAVLPAELKRLGVDVRIFTPRYGSVGGSVERLPLNVSVQIGDEQVEAGLFRAEGKGAVECVLIDCHGYFGRCGLYGERGKDYQDNAQRFAFFSRAVLEACLALNFLPDLFHTNEWQAALLPVYLRRMYSDTPLGRARVVQAVNNLGYQGVFEPEVMRLACLPWELFNFRQLEFYGKVNFLKAGIMFADRITTVSPAYAAQIKTKEYGMGLDGVLQERGAVLRGIVNGADYDEWNPSTDSLIPAAYSPANLRGKAKCKAKLQKLLGLEVSDETPLLGSIGRLTIQKGCDILAEATDRLVEAGFQLALLGEGEEQYEKMFRGLREKHPGKVEAVVAYDNRLAHAILAGSDMFVMPSRYEPCGLTQIYSLKYGTVPVVRATGGLDDTIAEFDPASGEGSGFKFSAASADDLVDACCRALEAYRDRKRWRALKMRIMAMDFSWGASALKYLKLYQEMCETA